MVKGDMIITSPVSENYLIFTTSERLDTYRLSGLAKAGQLVKLVDLSTNKYKLYILETDASATGGLKYTEILRRDTYDNTKVKYMILGENDDLPQEGDEKTDYYKLENNNYIHYRWIDNDYEIISGNSYSKIESDNRYTKTSSGNVPTTSTVGNPGDIIKANDALYECFGTNGTYYIWKKVSFGGGAAFTSEIALRDAIIAGDITAGMSISLLENGKYKNYIIQTVNTTTGAYTKTQSGGSYIIDDELPQNGDPDVDYYIGGEYNEGTGEYSRLFTHYRFMTSINDFVPVNGLPYRNEIVVDNEGQSWLVLYQLDGENKVEASRVLLPAMGGSGSGASRVTITRVTDTPLIITPTDRAIITANITSNEITRTGEDGEVTSATYTWKRGATTLISGPIVQGNNSFDLTDYIDSGSNTNLTLTVVDEKGSMDSKKWVVQRVDLRLESNFNDKYSIELNEDIDLNYTPYGAIDKTIYFMIDGNDENIESVSIPARISGTEQSYHINALSAGAHLVEMWMEATVNNRNIETEHVYKDIVWLGSTPIISCALRSDYRGSIDVTQYNPITIEYGVFDPSTSVLRPTIRKYVDSNSEPYEVVDRGLNTWEYVPTTTGIHTLKITTGEYGTSHYAEVTISLNVLDIGIDVEPITGNNLKMDFNPVGRSNDGENRLDSGGAGINLTVSNNFDWVNGGYKTDTNADGTKDSYFLIKAGTTATFDYKMFAGSSNNNIGRKIGNTGGAEMKIVFKTEKVQRTSATWFSNVETITNTYEEDGQTVTTTTNTGIQLNVHEGWLKTNNASDEDITITEGEGENTQERVVAATNTYLYTPYSDNDIIELDINVEPIDTDNNEIEAFIMAYEDGVPSKAYVYGTSDNLYQYTPQNITLGSEYCDVKIYRFKIYNRNLTTEEVMKNFIADARNAQEMLNRYNRNSVYSYVDLGGVVHYSPYKSQGGTLDPVLLAQQIPNVKVLMLETTKFTTSKKDAQPSSLRCIHAPGGLLYPGDPFYDNWLFEYGWHAGQGTTSDNYGLSGRNVDFLFNCDGVHYPTNLSNAKKSSITDKDGNKVPFEQYISKLTLGYNTEEEVVEYVDDWKGEKGKITLTRTSVPNNFYNFKVNVASSDNVNNGLLQKRYSDYLLGDVHNSLANLRVHYQHVHRPTAADLGSYYEKQLDGTYELTQDTEIDNNKTYYIRANWIVKNDMEFVPAILFIKECGPVADHTEFKDTNWHFYALGNLGDSKKTDYTRANDPDDPNEFTIEISDNTPNNATFQTGVFLDNGVATIETGHVETVTNAEGKEIEQYISDQRPSSFIYPVTIAQWNNAYNMRRLALLNEPYDGDHSFEPRYACCGDYRDGKLINATMGTKEECEEQLELNKKVWQAFYSWVVTATDEEFKRELAQWCVPEAMQFFYLFTNVYTMMDNRAKNTFWHFGKTGNYVPFYRAHLFVDESSNGLGNIRHILCKKVGNNYVPLEENEEIQVINSTKPEDQIYYTQYAFDIWDYDNDTALGINNSGELIFPYGREDTDYKIDNDPASGYIFNGGSSVFWNRLRVLFSGEITNLFNSIDSHCFESTNLIKQFDDFQNCYPEEIWRKDIERKYIRTFTGESIDNSINTKIVDNVEIKLRDSFYLQAMMQGRKKYQRRQWVNDQMPYFSSKYAKITDNRVYFRSAAKENRELTLKITPFTDMYICILFGNVTSSSNIIPYRTKAGEECSITCTLSSTDDTMITILYPERIQAISDLADFNVSEVSFGAAARLTKLIVGSAAPGYTNTSMTHLSIGSEVLEELDLRNCVNFSEDLNFTNNIGLKRLYLDGTRVGSVTFANNGKIELASLPNTVTTLVMNGLNNLTDEGLIGALNRLNKLTLSGGILNSYNFVSNHISTLREIYLHNINWTVTGLSLLKQILNLDRAYEHKTHTDVTGSVTVTASVRQRDVDALTDWYEPGLTINPTGGIKQQYQISFKKTENNVDIDLLSTPLYVDEGILLSNYIQVDNETGAYYLLNDSRNRERKLFDAPTLTPTWNNVYTIKSSPNDWDRSLSVKVQSDLTFYAQFDTLTRRYRLIFKDDDTIYQTTTYVNAGSTINFSAENGPSNYVDNSVPYLLKGWTTSGHKQYQTGDSLYGIRDNIILNYTFLAPLFAQYADVTQPTIILNATYKQCSLPTITVDGQVINNPSRQHVLAYFNENDYQFVYSNSTKPGEEGAFTIEELYAICMSDNYDTYLAPHDLAKFVLPTSNTTIGGNGDVSVTAAVGDATVGSGDVTKDSFEIEVLGFNVYEKADSGFTGVVNNEGTTEYMESGTYASQPILDAFIGNGIIPTDLIGKPAGLYINVAVDSESAVSRGTGKVYYWDGNELVHDTELNPIVISDYFAHVVWGWRFSDDSGVLGQTLRAIHNMNNSSITDNGWGDDTAEINRKCNMNSWMNDGNNSLFNMLPNELQSIITPVKVLSQKGRKVVDGTETFDKDTIVSSESKLFLLSRTELWGADSSNKYRKEINPWASLVTSRDSYNNSNVVKAYRYPGVSDTRKRKYSYYVNDTTQTKTNQWWLRSPDSAMGFCYVTNDGAFYGANYNGATVSLGVSPAFCVG